jgi:hypothetical protein
MNIYRVKAVMRTYLVAEIEAESEQEAWELANDLDGGLFEEVPYTGGWDVTDVILLDEGETPKFEPAQEEI